MLKKHNQLMIGLLGAADMAVLLVSWLCAYGLRKFCGRGLLEITAMPMPTFHQMFPAIAISVPLTILLFNRFGLYRVRRLKNLTSEASGMIQAIVTAWALTYIAANFFNRWQISRVLMASFLVSWLVLGVAMRITARSMLRSLRKRGLNVRYAAIVGTGRLAQALLYSLDKNSWTSIRTRYFVPVNPRDEEGKKTLCSHDVVGSVDQLDDILKQKPVDIVFVALSSGDSVQTEKTLNMLAETPVDVCVVPDLMSFHFLGHDISQLDNISIIGLTSSPQDGMNALLKRVFDVVFSLAVIIAISPVLLAIALAVKLSSPGPIFYVQQRASLGSQPFNIFKFRSMTVGAEKDTGAVWAKKNDARVTAVGAFLRKTSLDELPQFFNILRGDMSVVGPRPERPELIERFRKQIPRYMLRHSVKSGLTGWAQVNGLRGNTSLRKRVQYDLYYITNWSFAFDVRIIAMTVTRGFINPNAY